MNDDNWYQDSADDDRSYREDPSYAGDGGYVQPQSGMSTGVKVLIGCGVIGGVMALACCGGFMYLGMQVANMATEDPVEVRNISDEIAEIDLPDEFVPKFGMQGEMFGVGGQVAAYEDGEKVLMLMQMKGPAGFDAEQMQREFQRQLDQQGRDTDINVESTEQREITLAGQETTVQIIKGTSKDGKEMRQVHGVFNGRDGAAFVMYISPEEEWDEGQVIQLLETISTGNEPQAVDGGDTSEDGITETDEPVEPAPETEAEETDGAETSESPTE